MAKIPKFMGVFQVDTGVLVLVRASGSACNICGTHVIPTIFIGKATSETRIINNKLHRRFDFIAGENICLHQKYWWITDGTTLVTEQASVDIARPLDNSDPNPL